LAADYGISSYFKSQDGIYVNLFLPSRLSWDQGNSQCTLTQTTAYPRANTSEFDFKLAKPESFTVYLRIPAWAGAKTALSVNGHRAEGEITPGKFVAVQRTWKDGDRLELELHMENRLEAIAPENPNTVALLHGPLALFAVGDIPSKLTRKQLLSAQQASEDFIIASDKTNFALRPFSVIMDETYRLYHQVEG
jgi:uncharacterized protein